MLIGNVEADAMTMGTERDEWEMIAQRGLGTVCHGGRCYRGWRLPR